jgi:transposase
VVRFETAPGKQAQVDFAEFRLPWGKRFALLVVLGPSRLLWMRFYPCQTMQTVISGLEDAFAFFGGVP